MIFSHNRLPVAAANDLQELKASMLNISPTPDLVDSFNWWSDAGNFSVRNVAARLTSLVYASSEVDVKIDLNLSYFGFPFYLARLRSLHGWYFLTD